MTAHYFALTAAPPTLSTLLATSFGYRTALHGPYGFAVTLSALCNPRALSGRAQPSGYAFNTSRLRTHHPTLTATPPTHPTLLAISSGYLTALHGPYGFAVTLSALCNPRELSGRAQPSGYAFNTIRLRTHHPTLTATPPTHPTLLAISSGYLTALHGPYGFAVTLRVCELGGG